MKYPDGQEIMAGDKVLIDGKYDGLVVACIDANDFLPGHDGWAYLQQGIMVDTSFGGLVHYTNDATDYLELQIRRSIP
jgi:hypothetical protein